MAVTDAVDDVQNRLREVRQRVVAACVASGREPDEVRILPVTKTKPSVAVLAVHRMGPTRFGENKVQEARVKAAELQGENIEWTLIGHLQTNKARHAAEFLTEFQALDSLKLAAELDKRLQQQGRSLDVMVQVNSSDEPQKHGVAPAEVLEFTQQLRAFDSLRVTGLMTLAMRSDDPAPVARCFDDVRTLRDRLRERDGGGWDELSMGMSGDFELAIAHGATCVRIGQAIFGPRTVG